MNDGGDAAGVMLTALPVASQDIVLDVVRAFLAGSEDEPKGCNDARNRHSTCHGRHNRWVVIENDRGFAGI